jgi:hypothetical protein
MANKYFNKSLAARDQAVQLGSSAGGSACSRAAASIFTMRWLGVAERGPHVEPAWSTRR